MARFALDTNLLVYSEGVERAPGDAAKIEQSRRLIQAIAHGGERPVIAVQALAELHQVLVKRGGCARPEASARVRRVAAACEIAPVTEAVFEAALDLAGDHDLQIFDALILAAAVEARCDLLLSEDLQDGFGWRGVVVSNPFGGALDRRLERLLGAGG